MKQCVIFEIDGVILDTTAFHISCEKMLFHLMGINVSKEEHSKFFGTTDESMWSELGKLYELPISISEIIKLKETLFLGHIKNEVYLRPIPYVVDLIYELYDSGFTLAVASSSSDESINYILGELGLKKYFSCIVSSYSTRKSKPDPEILLKVSQITGIRPESCVVIEHTANGVKAAKMAKMNCLAYRHDRPFIQDLSEADLIISSFNEISALLISGMCCPVHKLK